MSPEARKWQRLTRRVRLLERQLAAVLNPPEMSGPPLTASNLVAKYKELRASAVRFIVLEVALDIGSNGRWMSNLLAAAEKIDSMRALQRVDVDPGLPNGGWELRPDYRAEAAEDRSERSRLPASLPRPQS